MKLYIGGLPYSTTNDELLAHFQAEGKFEIEKAEVVTDRDSGNSRGFGFVTVADEIGNDVIDAFNGTELGGRTLTVNEARPRTDAPRGGGFGGGNGGGYGGNRGGGYNGGGNFSR